LEYSHSISSHNKKQMFTHSYKRIHKNFAYFNLYVLLENVGRQHIVDQIVASNLQFNLILICNFGLLVLFSTIQTLPHFQRIY
jgi:hypothetical protein